ncbi:hypothetical protein [Rickettsia endosymbiont of Aspidapion aeneum]|uniref:hypothetical protein n=1 Tax=Rickettsia endosymbiont of Aspidapion aeneum TaxID=3066247 RepID=UPI00313D1FF1
MPRRHKCLLAMTIRECCCGVRNLPYYGYYKYGVIPWLDTDILQKFEPCNNARL